MARRKSLCFFKPSGHTPSEDPSTLSHQEKSLDLSCKIIEKELELERNLTENTINDLISIYSESIEFYSKLNDKKYIDLTSRMNQILTREDILNFFQSKPERNCGVTPSPATDLLLSPVPQRKPRFSLPCFPSRSPAAFPVYNPTSDNKSKILIKRNSESSKNSVTKAAADFKTQELSLSRRITARQKQKLNQNIPMPEGLVFQCDLSEVFESECSTKSSYLVSEDSEYAENFESRLEEILEEICIEKSKKIAEVRLKYEKNIEEVEGLKGMTELVNRLRELMTEEFSQIERYFEDRKREKVLGLNELSR